MKNAIPELVLAQHMAFLGKTGSGKSSTAKVAVEQIVRDDPNARVCILDAVKSDWWGLTSSADGKRPGLPFVILGGPRGHVPLNDSAGGAIGELVANGSLPLSIIDMADFTAGGLQKFFNDFAPALMKRMRGVLYLVLEEAHEFAPKERSGIGAENMAIHWAKKLATAGRSKGIRLMVLTQRIQALHNAVLGSCDTMIAHRITAPADQEPVKKWLKANVDKATYEQVAGSLASLKTGTGWICSGEAQVTELVAFPKITTYDNSATPTSQSGEHQVSTAPVDRDRLRSIIGDALKDAEANDPKKLHAEIARLTTLTKAATNITENKTALDSTAIAAAEQRGAAAARREASEELVSRILGFGMNFQASLNRLEAEVLSELSLIRLDVAGSMAMEPAPAVTARPAETPVSRPTAPAPASGANGQINSAGQKMLSVLDTNPPVRRSWTQTATLAGLKARGGHYNTGKKALLESGLIRQDDDLISIVKPTSNASAPLKPAALVEMWCKNLSGAAPKLLQTIFDNGGVMTQTAVAEKLGVQPRGGHWNSGWKELRDNDIVVVRAGTAELTELFKPKR